MDAYWAKLRSHKKRERASISQNLSYSALDLAIAFSLYLAAVLLCLFLRNIDQHQDTTYVAVIFFLDVFLTAYWTNGYLLGIITAVAGVFSVDYIFTYPYWHISFTLTGFPLTFLVMMTISVLTAAVTSRIDITLTQEGENAVFTVSDNGSGIPVYLLGKLFDGAARSDRTADGRRSMGIGLSVCRTVVQAHGGTIRGENKKEGGACFTVTLPMKGDDYED